MLYPHTDLRDDQVRARVRTLSAAEREAVATAYVGDRRNRPKERVVRLSKLQWRAHPTALLHALSGQRR